MNIWILIGIVLLDGILVVTLVGGVSRVCWGPFLKAFPAKPIFTENVRRNFQSYSIGLCNLGGCIHTVVDDDHLHLIPVGVLQWCGCLPVSVPWDQVLDHPQPGRSRRMVRVKIANQVVSGPRWALDCRLTLRKGVGGADAESEIVEKR